MNNFKKLEKKLDVDFNDKDKEIRIIFGELQKEKKI